MVEGAKHDPANPHSSCGGKSWLHAIPSVPRARPYVSTVSALSPPQLCLLPATHCIQQAAYGCSTWTMSAFLSTSTAPLSTAFPSSTGLHCDAPSHQHQPHTTRSLCISPPVNAQVCGSLPILLHFSQVLVHLWRDPTCLLQPRNSWFSKAPNTCTHTHLCSPQMPNHGVRLP